MVTKKNSHPAERDARTGEFVKKGTAARRPATTVTERIPNPGKGGNKKK